jgi:hypothetical protein
MMHMDDVERQGLMEAQEQLFDDTWMDVIEMSQDEQWVWDALGDEPQVWKRVARLIMRAMQSDPALRVPLQKRLARYAFEKRTRELENRQILKRLLEEHLKRAIRQRQRPDRVRARQAFIAEV